MKFKDYYAILKVPRDADIDQIKKAYRKLARKYHPDMSKAADAESNFKEVGEAYETLKDPEKRAAYDRLERRPTGEDFTPSPEWSSSFSQHGAGFEGVDLADIFAAMGRGDVRSAQSAPGSMARNGRDYEITVSVSLEAAYHGTTVNLELTDEVGGRNLEVKVPPGVNDGQKLRLRGKGEKGRNGGADGDVYLHIKLLQHAVFRTDHSDLYFDLILTPWEAVLGAQLEIPTLDGPVILTVPPGSSMGRKLRLKGRGLAEGKGNRGNLYAVVHVNVPTSLSKRESELMNELAQISRYNPRSSTVKESQYEDAPG